MKRMKEIIEPTEGIFYTMNVVSNEEYIELFGDLPPDVLDGDFYNMVANRFASAYVVNSENNEQLVYYILNRFYNQWKRIKETLTADYEVLNPYYKKETTEQETGDSTSASGNENSESGIYGFNEDDVSGKDTQNVKTDNASESKGTLAKTVFTEGNNGNQSQADLIIRELEIRKISFIQVVLNDCKELLTLSIY